MPAREEERMKAEIRELEIELIAETDHDREVLVKLHECREVTIRPGRTTDRRWPGDPRKTNIILQLPNKNNWGL